MKEEFKIVRISKNAQVYASKDSFNLKEALKVVQAFKGNNPLFKGQWTYYIASEKELTREP